MNMMQKVSEIDSPFLQAISTLTIWSIRNYMSLDSTLCPFGFVPFHRPPLIYIEQIPAPFESKAYTLRPHSQSIWKQLYLFMLWNGKGRPSGTIQITQLN